ncbi:MAG: NADH:flavin oxidoreductase [Acetobacterium woodii]|nr:NADH:flavin oxidoreductase [Acetobacterium woodii]
MNEVFNEAKLAGITLNNRIIRSATHEGMSDENGRPTETFIKKYEQLAKGGVGAIITGYVGVMANGKSPAFNMTMIDSNDKIAAFAEMVKRVHAMETPIIMQIAHCGRQTRSKITGYPTVAPSPIRDGLYNEDRPHELTESEIMDIIRHFVAAVERGKKAGFDGVQLHLAHGYLLSSFLSPHMNKRKDRWGGTTENRFRIVKEILNQSRKRVGDYPMLAKINAFEKSADGMRIDEAVKIAKMLEENGCDAIEVSSGIIEDGFWFARGEFPFEIIAAENFRLKAIPRFLHPLVRTVLKKQMDSPQPYSLYNLESAQQIKKQLEIPVIAVGGIHKLAEINDIIENNRCDFVSMARPFIIEPNIVNKFREGKQLESKCINCNFCVIGIDARPFKCYYGKIEK